MKPPTSLLYPSLPTPCHQAGYTGVLATAAGSEGTRPRTPGCILGSGCCPQAIGLSPHGRVSKIHVQMLKKLPRINSSLYLSSTTPSSNSATVPGPHQLVPCGSGGFHGAGQETRTMGTYLPMTSGYKEWWLKGPFSYIPAPNAPNPTREDVVCGDSEVSDGEKLLSKEVSGENTGRWWTERRGGRRKGRGRQAELRPG